MNDKDNWILGSILGPACLRKLSCSIRTSLSKLLLDMRFGSLSIGFRGREEHLVESNPTSGHGRIPI